MAILRQSAVWFSGFGLWFATLWWLSSRVHDFPPTLDFQASDKVLHFGWFFGGAGLLSAALFCRNPTGNVRRRILVAVIIVTLVGVLDEFHQSQVPGRQGNDIFDLTADFLGAIAGAFAFLPFQSWLKER